MYHTDSFALETAKEITLAVIQSQPIHPNEENAKLVGKFFQEIFQQVYEVSKKYDSLRR